MSLVEVRRTDVQDAAQTAQTAQTVQTSLRAAPDAQGAAQTSLRAAPDAQATDADREAAAAPATTKEAAETALRHWSLLGLGDLHGDHSQSQHCQGGQVTGQVTGQVPGQVISAAVGGYPAQPGRFPYIAIIESPAGYCTGFLVEPNKVYTAGHCVLGYSAPQCTVIVGPRVNIFAPDMVVATNAEIQKFISETKLPTPSQFKRKKMEIYSRLSGGFATGVQKIYKMTRKKSPNTVILEADWAILTLESTPPNAQPVRVVGRNKVQMPTDVITSKYLRSVGFGLTSPTGTTLPKYLQEIPIKIRTMDTRYLYGSGLLPGQSMCHGDSGGPLLMIGASPADDLVIGITDRGGPPNWTLKQGEPSPALGKKWDCKAESVFFRTDNIWRTQGVYN